ncbi:1634_t:CDS:2 [Racocetra fulgida]|uniref:1634_t:CDS:1 n=1 Tax=Racocetra fulgida TaxID=60492 RepID=A0A9N8YZH6_9GLOM|nr:1634_t:CDS:2 [Racocetra fulgida]
MYSCLYRYIDIIAIYAGHSAAIPLNFIPLMASTFISITKEAHLLSTKNLIFSKLLIIHLKIKNEATPPPLPSQNKNETTPFPPPSHNKNATTPPLLPSQNKNETISLPPLSQNKNDSTPPSPHHRIKTTPPLLPSQNKNETISLPPLS